ncbi:MAG: ERF family protein [Clostridia bacterium]|nr:ERF family protein [Clostridia bacterium]
MGAVKELLEEAKEIEKMNIYEKLLAVQNSMGVTERNAKGYGYKYVTEDVLQAKLTGAMTKYRVILAHSIIPETQHVETVETHNKKGEPVVEYRYTACSKYTWINVDNPSERIEETYAAVGQMSDVSQAFGAAETYCNRYFLMKNFQMPTPADDPDYIRSLQAEAEDGVKPAPQPAPTSKPVAPKATPKVSAYSPIDKEEISNMFNTATMKFGKDYGLNLIKSYMDERKIEASSKLTKGQYQEIMTLIQTTPLPPEMQEELPFGPND